MFSTHPHPWRPQFLPLHKHYHHLLTPFQWLQRPLYSQPLLLFVVLSVAHIFNQVQNSHLIFIFVLFNNDIISWQFVTVFFSGDIIYNVTDGFGWCFTAYCNATCDIVKISTLCETSPSPSIPPETTTYSSSTSKSSPETTQPATTNTDTEVTTTTYGPKCDALDPPKQVYLQILESCFIGYGINRDITLLFCIF